MKWFRRHIRLKLLGIFFLTGFVPFLVILIYSEAYGEKRMRESVVQVQRAQMAQIRSNIRMHLSQLQRDLGFLAEVGVMDDLLIGDLDRRVDLLLHSYIGHLDLNVSMLAIGNDETVAAATSDIPVGSVYPDMPLLKSAIGGARQFALTGNRLLLYAPVHASYSMERVIGYLVMEYRLSNLSKFMVSDQSIRSALVCGTDGRQIGSRVERIGLAGRSGIRKSGRELVLYETLDDILPGWYLVYQLDKTDAFSFLSQLQRYLVMILLGGLVVIALFSYWISRRIVAPLVALEKSAGHMACSVHDAVEIPVYSEDEIGRLAGSFNFLLKEIRGAFDALETQNRLRTRRLTQMIRLFDRLLRTRTESECIRVAVEEMAKVLPGQKVDFRKEETDTAMPALYVHDFEHDTLRYYGSLVLPEATMHSDAAEFYRSAARMIASRIDQIRAFERLRRDSEAKTSFISYLSHDLRTPLHAIMTQTQYLIGYETLSAAQCEKIGKIENSAAHLLGMINDLLDMAKLEAGKFDTRLETVPVKEAGAIVEEVIALFEPLAQQKSLQFECSDDLPAESIVVDRRLLRQIAANLLSNALKFTDSGAIVCCFGRSGGTVVLSICDTGRGIDPQRLSKVFDLFEQSAAATEGGERGSGLGLTLSREFARLFGAELVLESEGEGRGTCARLFFTTL